MVAADRDGTRRSGLQRLVLGALLFSGVASILNQVVWQRALKLFLGGSESISAMVVVLVFMLGLGIGSAFAGRRAARIADPLRAFGAVELALFAANGAIAFILSLELGESLYAAQRLALSAAIPLRLVYAVGATALLLPPTILMGATLPLAAEAAQRQLAASESRWITRLLALNTIGACLGALGGSFFLLPYFGQRVSLGVAAGFNLLAGLVVLAVRRAVHAARERSRAGAPALASQSPAASPETSLRRAITLEERLGFVLGFLSLGYEMFLLRLVALAHEPRPYTFAFTLLFFLLFWTFGVAFAGRGRVRPVAFLIAGAVAVAAMPWFYVFDRFDAQLVLYRGGLVYFLPCLVFGALYGSLVSRGAAEWGRDVGRFYALNTIGSCAGILFFSLVGYELPLLANALLIAMGLLAVAAELSAVGVAWRRGAAGLAAAGWLLVLVQGLGTVFSEIRGARVFWGRDGVIEIRRDGSLWIDGLWHSQLSDGTNHIGNPYNWLMAVASVLAHRDEPLSDGLVVGNGIGLTATTLARHPGVRVDAYEINRTFEEVLALFPEKTLRSGTNPRIHLRWQDGRSGLALDPKKYDVIISAPLHLRAAGSSSLLSREYLELVRSRLEPGGVVTLYSQEGRPEQAEIIRATVRSVFAYVETFRGGVLTVASDAPIEITPNSVAARMRRRDPLAREMRAFDRLLRQQGQKEGLFGLFDAERLPVPATRHLVTDDHPLVEYAAVAARLLARERRGADSEAHD